MSPAEPEAPARLTIHRTSTRDEQSRQILCSLDGNYIGQLLFGRTLTKEIPPGPHTISINNTLFWKKVPISARPGEHVHVTVWNQPFGGNVTRLLFIFIGAAPLKLGFASGPPDSPASPATASPAP